MFSSIQGRPYLSQHVAVQDLEHLVEAKLAESLHGVADESGSPALRQASKTIFPHCHSETVANALVFIWIHLKTRK